MSKSSERPSLKWLLITVFAFIVLGAAPFVWFAIEPDDFRAARELQSRGFDIIYNWMDDTILQHPTHIGGSDKNVTKEDSELMCRLPQLYAIHFLRGDMSGLNLDGIENCPELVFFRFHEVTQFPSNELRKLTACPNLESLSLSGISLNLTREDIEPLSACPNLVSVFLVSAGLSDADLDAFAAFPKLETLSLEGNTEITDAGLVHFEKISSLRELNLKKTSVTQNGADEFQKKRPDVKIYVGH